jgi:polyribonucleotide nucleotidyltransferase
LQLDELPVGTILRQRRVDSVTLFGVFVELAPGKSGLVHISELAEEGTLTEVPAEWKVGAVSAMLHMMSHRSYGYSAPGRVVAGQLFSVLSASTVCTV